MKMFAIVNKKTKRFVYSTDYTGETSKQKTSADIAKTYLTYKDAKNDFNRRKCNKNYAICVIESPVFIRLATKEDA